MHISSIKKRMTILVAALSLIVGACSGYVKSTAKETVRIDKKITSIAKSSSSKKGKTVSKSNYTYCNDDNLYVQNGKYLEQRTLNGKMVKKWNILPKVKPKNWELCYVNNKEILYSKKKNKKEELWSIPIVKTKKGDKLKPKKAKKVVTPEKDFDHNWGFENVYADKNYIAYTYRGEGTETRFAEYDRKAKKHIAIDSHSNNIYVALDGMFYDSCTWMNYVGTAGVILGSFHYDAKAGIGDEEIAEGIYFHKLGSGKVTKIGENYTDGEEGLMIASYGKKIFYTGVCRTKKDMENERQSDDIYVYDAAKKKARIFISGKRWNKFLYKKTGMKKTYLYNWRVDAGRLYLFAEGKGDYAEAFSCSVNSASKLVYEKKLNKFVKNKFFIHEVIKGKFMCSEPYSDEEGVEFADAIYYKKTGKGRIIKKSEREWYYWMYN